MYTVRKGNLLEILVPDLLMVGEYQLLNINIVNHLAYLLA